MRLLSYNKQFMSEKCSQRPELSHLGYKRAHKMRCMAVEIVATPDEKVCMATKSRIYMRVFYNLKAGIQPDIDNMIWVS